MTTLNLGSLRQLVTLENPGPPMPDGDGNWTQTWLPLEPPQAKAAIERASQRTLEYLFAGTVIGQSTLVVTMRFHPGVTLQTRLTWTDQAGTHHASVTVVSPDGIADSMQIAAQEIVA